jgi:O-acetyl-ADP-ribose deacetylase (regulator of RNase III)
MTSFKTGNILSEQVDALVNTVNCVGVMGRGVALQFKKYFPDNYKEYKAACDRKEVTPGRIFVHETGELYPRYIFNFPTKRHWRGKSKIEDIDAGMKSLISEIQRLEINSIAIPPLGSGLGGLDWNEVLPLIKEHLGKLTNVDVIIYEPNVAADTKTLSRNLEVPEMTPGRAALILLIDRYLTGYLDPMITLLELQKLMYFLQAAGEPLRLKYEKAHYGPYAPNLSHVLHKLEGHYVSGYGDGGDNPDKELALITGALEDARNVIKQHPNTERNINKVAELVEGFETPYGLELLASTHWFIEKEKPSTTGEVLHLFQNWNERKSQFTEFQITKACKVLEEKNWSKL